MEWEGTGEDQVQRDQGAILRRSHVAIRDFEGLLDNGLTGPCFPFRSDPHDCGLI